MRKQKSRKVNAKASSVPTVPPELQEAIRTGKCAVFVGAGLSVGAGYPNWTTLLIDLISKGRSRGWNVNAADERELKKLVSQPDKVLLVAEELRERFGRSHFEDQLVEVFKKDRQPTAVHRQLMEIPFSLAITTNYDLLLEKAYLAKVKDLPPAFTNLQPPEIAEALWRNDFFILKAHGDVNNRASFVLTERDYREIIHRSHGYRSALASIFTTKTVLFLGVSFSDPELRLLLGYLHDAFHGGTLHYALAPRTEFTGSVINRWRKDFRVECLLYTPSKGHPEVGSFVSSLPTR
ncbi:MAG: hypothetical protein BWX88_04345 [Planctomycetes bacterium ADurb.Bin126]|nr:MAG: hypothetical protein BWX88_04345 [Planctomycetes bacterium ADurb.Bin126]